MSVADCGVVNQAGSRVGESLLAAVRSRVSPRAGSTSSSDVAAIVQALHASAGALSIDRAAAQCSASFAKTMQPRLTAPAEALSSAGAIASAATASESAGAPVLGAEVEAALREANASANASVAALLKQFERSQQDANAARQAAEDAREASRQSVLESTAAARARIDVHFASEE